MRLLTGTRISLTEGLKDALTEDNTSGATLHSDIPITAGTNTIIMILTATLHVAPGSGPQSDSEPVTGFSASSSYTKRFKTPI